MLKGLLHLHHQGFFIVQTALTECKYKIEGDQENKKLKFKWRMILKLRLPSRPDMLAVNKEENLSMEFSILANHK